jgi:hypothetical protein
VNKKSVTSEAESCDCKIKIRVCAEEMRWP